jgi:hypothetical protein
MEKDGVKGTFQLPFDFSVMLEYLSHLNDRE